MTYPINQSHRPDPARVACPTAQPHKSIHHPDPASVVCPHGKPPWINPITPFQPVPHTAINQSHCPLQPVSRVPMKQFHRSSQYQISPKFNPIAQIQPVKCVPMARPHKSILSPRSSRAPPWHVPVNQHHRPDTSSVVCHYDTPHKSIPSPDPTSFKFPFKCLNLTKITNWSHILYNILRNPNNE